MAWAEAYLRTKWHLDPSSHLATTDMGRKGWAVPLGGGGAGSPSNIMWTGPKPTSVPRGILMHPAIWPQQTGAENWGALPLFLEGSLVPIYHNVAWAEAYLRTKWHLDPSSHLTTVDMGRKLGGCAPFLGIEIWVPIQHSVAWPRPISTQGGIVIHPTIWPQ